MTAGKWLKTACNLCYINCGIEVLVNDGRLEKVRGDRSSPKSQGYLCNKAARIPYYAHHTDRLTTPLRRRRRAWHDRAGCGDWPDRRAGTTDRRSPPRPELGRLWRVRAGGAPPRRLPVCRAVLR